MKSYEKIHGLRQTSPKKTGSPAKVKIDLTSNKQLINYTF